MLLELPVEDEDVLLVVELVVDEVVDEVLLVDEVVEPVLDDVLLEVDVAANKTTPPLTGSTPAM